MNTNLSTLTNQTGQGQSESSRYEIIDHDNDLLVLNLISVLDSIIIFIGTIGNLTSFYLLTRKCLRPISSMRYLAGLTLVDSICLYGWYLSSIYRQLNGDHLRRIENINPFLCKLISYMSFSSLQLSSILLCTLTIDRFLIIVSSSWRTRYANPKFATRIMVALTFVVLALNLVIPIKLGNVGLVEYKVKHFNQNGATTTVVYDNIEPTKQQPHNSPPLMSKKHSKIMNGDDANTKSIFFIENVEFGAVRHENDQTKKENITMCHCYDDNDKFLKHWHKVHLILYSLLPFPLLTILNLIVIRMTKDAARSATRLSANVKKFKNGQRFVTRLLLFLTISFIFTTLPSTIVYAFWHGEILRLNHGRVLLNLLNTLQFSRHSSNWLIYLYSSTFMRDELKKCLACTDSEYELAQAALAERPSVAIEILRQLELDNLNNTTTGDPDLCYYYYFQEKNNKPQMDGYYPNANKAAQYKKNQLNDTVTNNKPDDEDDNDDNDYYDNYESEAKHVNNTPKKTTNDTTPK